MNLFGRPSRSKEPEHIETVIGPSANLRGELRSDGGIRIEGAFEGLIETAGNLIVGEGARVMADITARNITVGGAIKGDVDATGRLEILSTGVVYGDINVQSVMIDQGGQFHGVSRMRGLDHPALAPPADHTSAPARDIPAAARANGVETVEAKARAAPEPIREAPVEAQADLDTEDDLEDFDLDFEVEPIIPGSEPTAENGNEAASARTSSRRRSTGGTTGSRRR